MQRFNVEKITNKIFFSDEDIFHIKKVLRKKIGDYLECIDQDNNLISSIIKSLNPFIAIVDTIKEYNVIETYPIDLYVSLLKKKEFEFVVEKMNELNINSITPVFFSRTQGNLLIDLERLNRISKESCKQCKRHKNIIINTPITYKKLVEKIKENNNFLFANEKECQNNLDSVKINFNKNIGLIIGPEGGFVSQEIDELSSLCSSIVLTKTILRAETACLYLVSCIIEDYKKNEK